MYMCLIIFSLFLFSTTNAVLDKERKENIILQQPQSLEYMLYPPYYDSIIFADFLHSHVYSKCIYNEKRQFKAKSGNTYPNTYCLCFICILKRRGGERVP